MMSTRKRLGALMVLTGLIAALMPLAAGAQESCFEQVTEYQYTKHAWDGEQPGEPSDQTGGNIDWQPEQVTEIFYFGTRTVGDPFTLAGSQWVFVEETRIVDGEEIPCPTTTTAPTTTTTTAPSTTTSTTEPPGESTTTTVPDETTTTEETTTTQPETTTTGEDPTTTTSEPVEELPFTGLDVDTAAMLGVSALAAGILALLFGYTRKPETE